MESACTQSPEERFRKVVYRAGSVLTFLLSAVVYILLVEPGASFWDCPEYITTAYRLEIGHPPGNPAWSLMACVASHLAPDASKAALAVNLTSGLFTALAMALLYQSILVGLRYVTAPRGRGWGHELMCGTAAFCGSMCMAWADSTLFSAVEAEVYAMSLFFTSLMVRMMLMWAFCADREKGRRLLIAIAYITGLSMGVHELNLLAITAMALIYVFRRRGRHATAFAWAGVGVSFIIIACLLLGLMPGTISLAGEAELIGVNRLGLPPDSGALTYIGLTMAAAIAAPLLCGSRVPKALSGAAVGTSLFLSGLFLIGSHYIVAALLSAVGGVAAALLLRRRRREVITAAWMLAMTLTGYSVYLLIPIRAHADPSMNQGDPSTPFGLLSYVKRDQYGSKPLLYGRTPYSRRLMVEERDSAGAPRYSRFARERKRPLYRPWMEGAAIGNRQGLLDSSDSAYNARVAASGKGGYIVAGYTSDYLYAPELDMWFPRMTSSDAADIEAYGDWSGMKRETMDSVDASYAVDSAGTAVGKAGADRKRSKQKELRPTYMQQLRYMAGYQIGYMYLRYLMWNFSGRQNDRPATGEIDHGNFITGIAPIDNAMLGDQDKLPPELGRDNPGRNRYFMLPLLLGIAGAIWLIRLGRRGRRMSAVTLALFLLAGVAIVVYLNQDPREARERDYSFLGSFMAYSVWIGCGSAMLLTGAMRLRRGSLRTAAIAGAAALSAGLPVWMLAENIDDHDRRGRYGATALAVNMLESLDRDAILFVDGDNTTFPLWYAREVLGVRRDVTILNMAYLTTSWHVAQALRPEEGRRQVASTARPADILYGAFDLVEINPDAAGSADAVEALRGLYRQRPASGTPRLDASRLRVALAGGDSAVIDLSGISVGGRSLMLQQLAVIDIVASNAASERPRPIYWQRNLRDRNYAGFRSCSAPTLFTYRYGATPAEGLAEGLRASRRLLSGGADRKDIYADPYMGQLVSFQRMSAALLARRLLQAGDTADARGVALRAARLWPFDKWPAKTFNVEDSAFNEAYGIAGLLRAGSADGATRSLADSITGGQDRRRRATEAYIKSLTPAQRLVVSPETRAIISK